MRRVLTAGLLALAALAAAGLPIFFFVLPAWFEGRVNPVLEPAPYSVPDEVASLHRTLLVADLHADSLLWGRDLLERSDRGQVDIPRLIDGNVALQVFSVVTKSPRGLNIERNDDTTDDITLLAMAQRWPFGALFSLKARALYQAERLRALASLSGGRLTIVRSARDLSIFLERRRLEGGIVAGLLALEGAHVLEGDPANLDAMFDAGYRMMSFAHFFDNQLAGSAHGVAKGGLTTLGREVLRAMEESRIIVDLAHASDSQIEDVLAAATRPVVVSHSGVRGVCDNRRNLTDDQLRAIAGTGGLIGIGFWETATCGRDAAAIARAIRHASDIVGVDHVALGSDFDGAVPTPFDATGMAKLTEALLDAGFTADETGRIMGGNQIRFLLDNLPAN